MKKIFISLICLILLCLIIFHYNSIVYEKNYWEEIGLGDNGSHLYKDIVHYKGKPINTWATDKSSSIQYDDVIFTFSGSEFKGAFYSVEILGEEYRFGKRKVGINSNRKDIEKAYGKFIRKIKDTQGNSIGYIDNDTWITYIFNEQDIVSKIFLGTGP